MNKRMQQKQPSAMRLFTAVGMIVLGAALLIAGFIVSPTGEIHSSVLIGFGEILTFAGALFGIDWHYRNR